MKNQNIANIAAAVAPKTPQYKLIDCLTGGTVGGTPDMVKKRAEARGVTPDELRASYIGREGTDALQHLVNVKKMTVGDAIAQIREVTGCSVTTPVNEKVVAFALAKSSTVAKDNGEAAKIARRNALAGLGIPTKQNNKTEAVADAAPEPGSGDVVTAVAPVTIEVKTAVPAAKSGNKGNK